MIMKEMAFGDRYFKKDLRRAIKWPREHPKTMEIAYDGLHQC